MIRIWIHLVVAVFAFGTFVHGQTKPNFSGTWVMVAEKSDFGPLQRPDKMTRTIAHKDPVLQLSTVQSGAATGDAKTDLKYTTDGKPQANTFQGAPMTTVGTWEGSALIFKSSLEIQGVSITTEDRYVLSDGGKTLTIDRVLTSPDGSAKAKVVFTKQ